MLINNTTVARHILRDSSSRRKQVVFHRLAFLSHDDIERRRRRQKNLLDVRGGSCCCHLLRRQSGALLESSRQPLARLVLDRQVVSFVVIRTGITQLKQPECAFSHLNSSKELRIFVHLPFREHLFHPFFCTLILATRIGTKSGRDEDLYALLEMVLFVCCN